MSTNVGPRISFFGVPVYGDYEEGEQREDQWPIEKLQPLLLQVLNDPGCGSFGWAQYTPYFNDGDPCVFGVHAFWTAPAADAVETADDEDEEGYYGIHESYGNRPSRWDPDQRKYVDMPYEGPDEARYDRLVALKDAIEGGRFLDVLLVAFGDHAEVTVRKDRIDVESYHHD